MSLAKRIYPKAKDYERRRQFRAVQYSILIGLVAAGLVGLVIYWIYQQRYR